MRMVCLSSFIFLNIFLSAQKYDIKGVIKDTLGEPLIAATVMLMDKDSILIEYTQTDLKGAFDFKSVRDKSCLIKTSYLGYFSADCRCRI